MSKKQKILGLIAKLKEWSESAGDEALDKHIKDLEDEINASFDPADDGEDGSGGNHPTNPPGKP